MVVLTTPSLPAAPSDEQLLTRREAGDRLALEELFRRHRQPAYRVAYRLLGNEADALDAVQEGFVKVLTNLAHFEGAVRSRRGSCGSSATPPWTWASAAAAPPSRATPPREGAAPLVWDDPALGLERADLRRLLDEALAHLPEAQRQTFVLHVDAELSYREVADALGISIGTVMSRLY